MIMSLALSGLLTVLINQFSVIRFQLAVAMNS